MTVFKQTVIATISLLIPFVTYSGQFKCPDLEQDQDISGWIVIGNLSEAPFKSVLISKTRVMGNNTVTCKYDQGISLFKTGNFQPGINQGLWEPVNIGGLSYEQCLATLDDCSFFTQNY